MKAMILAAMLACIAMLASPVARADLYAAEAAAKAKDYERAFALFRELAELGNVQETDGDLADEMAEVTQDP